MRVLILDGQCEAAENIRKMLSGIADTVDIAANMEDAARMAESLEYDFVLLDYQVPEYEGTWFMKNVNISKHTKVLLMSAYVDRTAINEMFELGVAGYLIKPFDDAELRRHIEFHSSQSPAR